MKSLFKNVTFLDDTGNDKTDKTMIEQEYLESEAIQI